ncbi:uncharacterized protein EpC_35660 [Erwinia pyrifoliae Ep1/96]|nr:uncharacterized protein EpC_35660 [Erwinia pyrifoliae Ep1/96]
MSTTPIIFKQIQIKHKIILTIKNSISFPVFQDNIKKDRFYGRNHLLLTAIDGSFQVKVTDFS